MAQLSDTKDKRQVEGTYVYICLLNTIPILIHSLAFFVETEPFLKVHAQGRPRDLNNTIVCNQETSNKKPFI